jgi:hypothetical protein
LAVVLDARTHGTALIRLLKLTLLIHPCFNVAKQNLFGAHGLVGGELQKSTWPERT